MFHRRSFFFRALLALIILVGFVAAGMMAYRAGAAYGYAQGTAATDVEANDLRLVPAHPFLAFRMARYAAYPHFFLLRPLFCGGVLFLIALAVLFRPLFWHHPPMMWHKHHHWAGHPHSWSEDKEQPAEADAEARKKTSKAGAR